MSKKNTHKVPNIIEEIDLSKKDLFNINSLNLAKINYIYGKNGTGKTTLTETIKSSLKEKYDVRIFQGFESVIDENIRLNAVVLGSENVEINKIIEDEIEKKRKLNEELVKRENYYEETILKDEEKLSNALKNTNTEVDKKLREIAAFIKKESNPQISKVTYNIIDLKKEIDSRKKLREEDINNYIKYIKEDEKVCDESIININKVNNINWKEIIEKTNEILNKKVEEKIVLPRLDTEEKKLFAEKGMRIHKEGDFCAFCGNIIDKSTIQELEKVFSVDEVNLLRRKIETQKNNLENLKTSILGLNIETSNFYEKYKQEVYEIFNDLNREKEKSITILDNLLERLSEKEKNLFEELDSIENKFLDSFNEISKQYNIIAKKNNSDNNQHNKEIYKKELRLHKINEELEKINYEELKNNILIANDRLNEFRKDKKEPYKNEIISLKKDIEEITEKISKLQEKTIDVGKLANNINKKLRHISSFELCYREGGNFQGFYNIKCLRTGNEKNVENLSTGEKNIIAFLYFIEKLKEINSEEKEKVIIFDDPMNSNDETMQYLMMDELERVKGDTIKNYYNHKMLIILTHNAHFYININYEGDYKNINHIRLIYNGKNTTINYITRKELDLKTSYETLWKELKFIYNNEQADAAMMLNPIRRIIETFTKFMNIKKREFLRADTSWLKKYLDVNSHSIDDYGAELDALGNKKEIIDILERTFTENGFKSHFDKNWND